MAPPSLPVAKVAPNLTPVLPLEKLILGLAYIMASLPSTALLRLAELMPALTAKRKLFFNKVFP